MTITAHAIRMAWRTIAARCNRSVGTIRIVT
jgi:hypothetical protein